MRSTVASPVTLTSDQVEGYLLEHPDFFINHEHLLENMHIPHPSGKAVSLITKQLELYRTRHEDMQTRLNNLIDIAKENDISSQRMHQLTLAMLEANSLEEVLVNLKQVLTDCFFAEFVTLRIITDYPNSPVENLFIAPDNKALSHFQKIIATNLPCCKKPTIHQARLLFAEAAMKVKSCAIVPMMYTDIEGFIAIGSSKKDRYHPSMGNLFLTQMSEIIATRLIPLIKQQ